MGIPENWHQVGGIGDRGRSYSQLHDFVKVLGGSGLGLIGLVCRAITGFRECMAKP